LNSLLPEHPDTPHLGVHGTADGQPQLRVTWSSVMASATGHTVPVRVFRPSTAEEGCLVWAHGGSWITGSVEGWHQPCAELAALSGWVIVSVEYRLAPAHRHPDGLEDVLTALAWAAECLTEGARDIPLAVGGDSAGGTLAASAALAWRGRRYALSAQVLAYPPLDPACAFPSFAADDAGFPRRGDMQRAWRMYAGPATRTSDAPRPERHLTALQVEDLHGAAPAVITVGALDPVRDEVRAYADRLIAAGTSVSFRQFPGTEHGAFIAPGAHGRALRAWLADSVGETARSARGGDSWAEPNDSSWRRPRE
jgi:acetyl esterase